ncbi:hypothetical protein ARMGADRAFT_119232 [Armillaria gallica]|uniref:Uncharacterized protein n=1 Tax=Armillaria gallica TaxID=47427 RepID=A0A2H3CCN4_ARMGA|nr:hypothetical protein ARMGADRAFT_119232 [Armillaria gallica]
MEKPMYQSCVGQINLKEVPLVSRKTTSTEISLRDQLDVDKGSVKRILKHWLDIMLSLQRVVASGRLVEGILRTSQQQRQVQQSHRPCHPIHSQRHLWLLLRLVLP